MAQPLGQHPDRRQQGQQLPRLLLPLQQQPQLSALRLDVREVEMEVAVTQVIFFLHLKGNVLDDQLEIHFIFRSLS